MAPLDRATFDSLALCCAHYTFLPCSNQNPCHILHACPHLHPQPLRHLQVLPQSSQLSLNLNRDPRLRCPHQWQVSWKDPLTRTSVKGSVNWRPFPHLFSPSPMALRPALLRVLAPQALLDLPLHLCRHIRLILLLERKRSAVHPMLNFPPSPLSLPPRP